MNDEELTEDTIDDDLRKRQQNPQGPVRSKISNFLNQKIKEGTAKAKQKIKYTLFNPVGITVFSTVFSIFTVIVLLIGIVSFIISMPGLVQEKIISIITDFEDGLMYYAKGTDYYLQKIVEDENQTKQKEVLKYLSDMGIDPVGFGFAPFYSESTDSEGNVTVTYEPAMAAETQGLTDEEIRAQDLILKYIVSNERTYLIDDRSFWGRITDFYTLRGMIKANISGPDDSSITVDRENKQMVISSLNVENLQLKNQKVRYNLEDWTGRYGMPLEFLLALHLSTMAPDLAEEMVTNPNLTTEVILGMPKNDYKVTYTIKVRNEAGELVEFPIDAGGNYLDLSDFLDSSLLDYDSSTDTYSIKLDGDQIKKFRDNLSVESLLYWVEHLSGIGERRTQFQQDAYDLTMEGLKALMGEDEFRVSYHIVADYRNYSANSYDGDTGYGNDSATALDWTAYLGKFKVTGENSSVIDRLTSKLEERVYDGYKGYNYPDLFDNMDVPEFKIYDDESKIIFVPKNDYYSGNCNYTTAKMYGLRYYINHVDELRNNRIALNGITAMLSQMDSFLYWRCQEITDKDSSNEEVNNLMSQFTEIRPEDQDSMPFTMPYNNDPTQQNVTHLLLTKEWYDFCGGTTYQGLESKSDTEIIAELTSLILKMNKDFDIFDHMTTEQRQQVLNDVVKQLGIGVDKINIDDLKMIYDIIKDKSKSYEMVLPQIKMVIKHWYKDVIFSGLQGISSKVYSQTSDTFDAVVDTGGDSSVEITAHFSGEGAVNQTGEPLVVKGDIITLDGKIVDENSSRYIVEDYDGNDYTLGDGYRTTKKIFTQGKYYIFDGSKETSQSIYYAKVLENLASPAPKEMWENADDAGNTAWGYDGREEQGTTIWDKEDDSIHNKHFARITVTDGRIILLMPLKDEKLTGNNVDNANIYNFETDTWNTDVQVIDEERAGDNLGKVYDGDGYSIFLYKATKTASGGNTNIYYIKVDKQLEYLSPASHSIEETDVSVARINNALAQMGIITQRTSVTFDSTTSTGDVTAMLGLSILEKMHTEDAELIYRDFKELLIELGYYTKAEFDYLDTKVLNWFIPAYTPKNGDNWRQNKDEDALLYGAIIYPKEEKETNNSNSDNTDSSDGFEKDLEVVAPGNCRIKELTDKSITLKFDGATQPEIGVLDRYIMIINGIRVDKELVVQAIDGEGNDVGEKTLQEIANSDGQYIIKAETVIGYTGTEKIQIVMMNSRGGKIDDIENYMGPNIATSLNGTPYSGNFPDKFYYYLACSEGMQFTDEEYMTHENGNVNDVEGYGRVTVGPGILMNEYNYQKYVEITGDSSPDPTSIYSKWKKDGIVKLFIELVDNGEFKKQVENYLGDYINNLSTEQVEALILDAYQRGPYSTTLMDIIEKLKSGASIDSVKEEWIGPPFIDANGNELKGVQARRYAEWYLFKYGIYIVANASNGYHNPGIEEPLFDFKGSETPFQDFINGKFQ